MASKNIKSAPVYRSTKAIADAFRKLNESANESAHDVIRGTLAFMQARGMSVSQMQAELKECKSGVLTHSHVAYFTVADSIYSRALGATSGKPSDVVTMASRMQYVYGKDDALKRIGELTAAGIPFAEWSKKDADGNAVHVPTVAETKAKRAAEKGTDGNGGEGKGDGGKPETVKEPDTLDTFVLASLVWLKKHKNERRTSQPDSVAELVAILNSVTVKG